MADQQNLPTYKAEGRFEALFPFDQVVKPEIYYTVHAIESITKMEVEKENLYELMFAPIGVTQEDYPTIMERAKSNDAAVVTLLDRNNSPVYVFSTYFKSFPQVDGVTYEIMCLVANLGPQMPNNADLIEQTRQHMTQYILDTLGIAATVTLGTVPTIGYVSAEQAEAFENSRKELITNTTNDISRIRELEAQVLRLQNYVLKLEAAVPTPDP